MRGSTRVLATVIACAVVLPACTSANIFTGRRAMRVSERNLAEARTALGRDDGAAATQALSDAIFAARVFERSRPSARIVRTLDAALADVENGDLPGAINRVVGLREPLVDYDVYVDTADTLQMVDEAIDAAARGDTDTTRALLMRTKAAVRLRTIDRELHDGHAALGAAYRNVALGRYRKAETDVAEVEAAFRRAENKILLAHALAAARRAEAAAPAQDYREAGRQVAAAADRLGGVRGGGEGVGERRLYEIVGQLHSLDERARLRDAGIWSELPEARRALEGLLGES